MKLQQIQKKYIAPRRNFNAGSNESLLGNIMQTAGVIANKIAQTQDASKSIKVLNEASEQFNKTIENYRIQYFDKPEEFNKKITEYKQQLFDDTIKNSDISLLNKNTFKSLAEKQFTTFNNTIFKTTQLLKENNIKTNLDNSIEAINNTSYLQGKTGDYNSFINNLSKNILQFKVAGQQVYIPQELNLRLSNLTKSTATNYIEGLIVSNLIEAKNQLLNGNFNNLLSQKEIDNYLNTINKIEEIQKEAETKQIDNATRELLTSNMINYNSLIESLNTSTKDGVKNKITEIDLNEDFNKITKANLLLQEAKQNKLSNDKYITEQSKLYNIVYNNFIDEKEIKSKKSNNGLFNRNLKNVNTILVDYLNGNFNSFDKENKARFYLDLGTALKQNNFDFTSTNIQDLSNAKKIIDTKFREIYNIPENENIQQHLSNNKINEQIKYNDQVLKQFENNDPYNIL